MYIFNVNDFKWTLVIYNKLKQQLDERSRINYGNCLIFRMAVSKLSEFLIWNQWKDKMKWI